MAKVGGSCQMCDVIIVVNVVRVVVVDLPHVDQVLRQSDGFCVSGNGDCAIRVAAGLAILAVGNTDHGSAELSEIKMGILKF